MGELIEKRGSRAAGTYLRGCNLCWRSLVVRFLYWPCDTFLLWCHGVAKAPA